MKKYDIAIIGGGAAGLTAAIWAARTDTKLNIAILDGAKKLGAKILVAGGGRCNVTHYQVSENDFGGGSRHIIKKILRRFDTDQTVAFFHQLGVKLKREETGKLFPVSDSAHDVLFALLDECRRLGVHIYCNHRVESITKKANHFLTSGTWGSLQADKVILATGGKSLPKTGSDGGGYRIAQALGHSLTPEIFPALVPLLLPKAFFIARLSGLTVNVALTLANKTGKALRRFTGSLLCTHFGISGPVTLDISRYWIDALKHDENAKLLVNWLPEFDQEKFAAILLQEDGKTTVRNFLRSHMPTRLADALCTYTNIAPAQACGQMHKAVRKKLAETVTAMQLPITGDRGYTYAEATAGGVPLMEIEPKTMASRRCENLFLCGEICDVDGRIGGFNFQWAWSSGYVAGRATTKLLS